MHFPRQVILFVSRVLALAGAITIGSTTTASAESTLTLTWDPNPEPDIAGYVVFYGTRSGSYGSSVDVGAQTSFQLAGTDPAASYYFAVRAYNVARVQSAFSREVSTTGSLLNLTSLTSSVRAPQSAGTSITFTAAASGGAGPIHYKWLVYDGSIWRVAQEWSPSTSYTWTPTEANPSFRIGVWVRSAMSTADVPEGTNAGTSLPFTITANTDVTVTRLKADRPSPQALGARVVFSAAASGAKTYNYKWWVFNGKKWAVAQEWSSSSKLVWKPAAANAGYQVLVRVRDARNSKRTSAGTSMAFPIAKRKR